MPSDTDSENLWTLKKKTSELLTLLGFLFMHLPTYSQVHVRVIQMVHGWNCQGQKQNNMFQFLNIHYATIYQNIDRHHMLFSN